MEKHCKYNFVSNIYAYIQLPNLTSLSIRKPLKYPFRKGVLLIYAVTACTHVCDTYKY